jgi:hypothetical protein
MEVNNFLNNVFILCKLNLLTEIPEQITVDGGTETGQMRACHVALR